MMKTSKGFTLIELMIIIAIIGILAAIVLPDVKHRAAQDDQTQTQAQEAPQQNLEVK